MATGAKEERREIRRENHWEYGSRVVPTLNDELGLLKHKINLIRQLKQKDRDRWMERGDSDFIASSREYQTLLGKDTTFLWSRKVCKNL